MKVITYQSASGDKINLAISQSEALRANGAWPKDSQGREYCTVSHGLHEGIPTWTDEELNVSIYGRAKE